MQTFNFYGLMLNAPVVFRVKQYADDGVTELTNRVVFDYAAILIVNSGDLVGNFSALLALRMKTNPRRVAAACAAISVPMLFVPLVPALNSHRWGLVFLMLSGGSPPLLLAPCRGSSAQWLTRLFSERPVTVGRTRWPGSR